MCTRYALWPLPLCALAFVLESYPSIHKFTYNIIEGCKGDALQANLPDGSQPLQSVHDLVAPKSVARKFLDTRYQSFETIQEMLIGQSKARQGQ